MRRFTAVECFSLVTLATIVPAMFLAWQEFVSWISVGWLVTGFVIVYTPFAYWQRIADRSLFFLWAIVALFVVLRCVR